MKSSIAARQLADYLNAEIGRALDAGVPLNLFVDRTLAPRIERAIETGYTLGSVMGTGSQFDWISFFAELSPVSTLP